MPFDGRGFDYDPRITPAHVVTLKKAEAHIAQPDGWSQGNFIDGNARCIMGALYGALPSKHIAEIDALREFSHMTLVPVLEDPVRWACPGMSHPGCAVSHFNDHSCTTKADVLALFDRGIARAEIMVAYRRACLPTRWERLTDRMRALFGKSVPSPHDFHDSTITSAQSKESLPDCLADHGCALVQ